MQKMPKCENISQGELCPNHISNVDRLEKGRDLYYYEMFIQYITDEFQRDTIIVGDNAAPVVT